MLTLAMMLSVMVMNTGAAFSDQNTIDTKHTEAVDNCVALKIINGFDNKDGTFAFQPNGDVTRAQMCKMICVAMNGGKTPALGTAATSSFTDVATSHWASPYIEACVSQGIVAGIGGGKFNPDGQVTGTQAAKMLLIALGYDADNEGLVGAGWDVNTNVLATKSGLYDELEDIDVSAALTREHAAEMIWNCLQANEVEYTYTLVSDGNGGMTSKVKVQEIKNILGQTTTAQEDWYNSVTKAYLLVDVTYDEDRDEYTNYLMPVNEDTYAVMNSDGCIFNPAQATNFSCGVSPITVTTDEDYSDLFMQNVKVVTDKNGDVLSMYSFDTTVLATATLGDLEDYNDGGTDKKITVDGTEYKVDATNDAAMTVYYNLDWLKNGNYPSGSNVTIGSLGTIPTAAFSYEMALIDRDDNGKADYIVVYPVAVGQVTYVGSKSINVADVANNSTKFTFEDDSIYEGVAKDDYVVITNAANTVNEDMDVVVKADVTSATVTAKKTDKLQLDGEWYDSCFTADVKDDVDVVIINGVVMDGEIAESTNEDLLYVSAVRMDGSNADIQTDFGDDPTIDMKAYFPDGSSKVITVSELNGVDPANDACKAAVQLLYTYEVNKDGNYELKVISSTNDAGFDDFQANGKSGGFVDSSEKLGGFKLADDAVIFVQDNDGVSVVSGKAMKDWNANFGTSYGALTNEANGIDYVQVGFVYANAASPVSLSDTQYAYVTEAPYATTVLDDDGEDVDVMAIEVWTADGAKTLYVDDGQSGIPTGLAEGAVIVYQMDGQYVAYSSGALKLFALDKYDTSGSHANLDCYVREAAITGMEYEDEGDVNFTKVSSATWTDTTSGVGYYASSEKVYAMDEDVVFVGISTDDADNCEQIGMNDVQIAGVSYDDNYVCTNAYIVVNMTNDTIVAIFWDVDNELLVNDKSDQVAE